MSDDSNIQVQFTAQIQGLLDGLGKAQSSVKEATEGMTGSISKMAETMENLGVASIALAGVGLAFEGLKAAVEYVAESVEKTNELAHSFAKLEYSTGATNAEMNQYVAAIQLSGGGTEDLTGLMQGMTRSVKANAEGLIANGVAADKASLQNMGFGEYMEKVNEIAHQMASPLKKNEFLMLALGRAGAKTGMLLDEFCKHADEAAGKEIISAYAIEQMHLMEEAEGRLKNAEQAHAAGVSAWAARIKMSYLNAKASVLEYANESREALDMYQHGLIQAEAETDEFGRTVITDMDKAIAKMKEWNKNYAEGLKTSKDSMDVGAHFAGEEKKQTYHDPADDAAKAAAAKAAAEAAKQAKIAAAQDAYMKTKILLEQEVADNKKTEEEATKALMNAVKVRTAAELAANSLTNAEKLEITRRGQNEIAELGVKATKEGTEARRKADAEEEKENEAFHKVEQAMAKEDAREQIAASKDALTQQKANLDQKVAMGRMTEAQELAARKSLINAELALDKDAINKEQELALSNYDIATYEKLEHQKLDITRKADAQLAELNRKSAADQINRYHQIFQAMTSGFSSSIAGLIKGTMSWGEATKSVLNSALDGLINFFVQWGLKEAERWAMSLIMGETNRETEATGAAAVYAVNAAASVAAIPIVGWAMATGVAEDAYMTGMAFAGLASAAGGWDQVPSDQLAMIHKNEMVMSAPLASGIRQIISNNGQGGSNGGGQGGDQFHVHAMDAKSVKAFLNKSVNQTALSGTLRSMVRNGRTR